MTFSLENVTKLAVLKKQKEKNSFIFEKKSMVARRLLNMQTCSTQASVLSITGKPTWWGFSFPKVAGLEFIPACLLKRTPTWPLHGSSLINFRGISLQNIF